MDLKNIRLWLGGCTVIRAGHIAVRQHQIPSVVLQRITFLLALASFRINCLLIHFPLHDLVRLAAMKAYEIAGTTLLRIRVKAIAHSPMSHELVNVGLMLTTETLLCDT